MLEEAIYFDHERSPDLEGLPASDPFSTTLWRDEAMVSLIPLGGSDNDPSRMLDLVRSIEMKKRSEVRFNWWCLKHSLLHEPSPNDWKTDKDLRLNFYDENLNLKEVLSWTENLRQAFDDKT
ncbi:unnamed protein product [Linum trigynum]|uniref:Uncharacterized protein n=1 Tax=Linum trigynum TaxID=586398 RepID=A0AAV2DEM1_9ROSI